MARTFEERLATELDSLYQGALFLSGGEPSQAEKLLVEAVSRAFREYSNEPSTGSFDRWVEGRLVRVFLERAGETTALGGAQVGAGASLALGDPEAFRTVPAKRFFEAAGWVPEWPRAALWLVLLRRWSYAEAARALDVDRASLVELLGWRDALMARMIGRTRGNGARGVGS